MDEIWAEMYRAAAAVRGERALSPYLEAGSVAAAVLSAEGRIYTGVCVDACCGLGVCAERNAIFQLLTAGGGALRRVLVLMPDGTLGLPCGACRELMMQLMPAEGKHIAFLLDTGEGRTVTLGELTPRWWI